MERFGDHERSGITRRKFLGQLVAAGLGLSVGSRLNLAQEMTKQEEALTDNDFLSIQARGFDYFIQNQTEEGLFLDRQTNGGPRIPREKEICSTAATGMGFISLALAAGHNYGISHDQAVARCARGFQTVLHDLPQDHGLYPHFVEGGSALRSWGDDAISTIDSAWLIAGAGCAAELLHDDQLRQLFSQMYQRVDWGYWTGKTEDTSNAGNPLLVHGKDKAGRFFPCRWDKLNCEHLFMYILAAGAEKGKSVPADTLDKLQLFMKEIGGISCASGDLGLFVHQSPLVDLDRYRNPGPVDLRENNMRATRLNIAACMNLAQRYQTYESLWGISAGDGDGGNYKESTPLDCDGTAHVTATVASIEYATREVAHNIFEAGNVPGLLGRYGFSNVKKANGTYLINREVVGFDIGAAVIALENFCNGKRVRNAFHSLLPVQRGVASLGFRERNEASAILSGNIFTHSKVESVLGK